MGDHYFHRDHAFHRGDFHLLSLNCSWLLNAIFPSTLQLQPMGEQEVQHPASDLESGLLDWALPREQAEPVYPLAVGKAPHRHSVQVSCREQSITW